MQAPDFGIVAGVAYHRDATWLDDVDEAAQELGSAGATRERDYAKGGRGPRGGIAAVTQRPQRAPAAPAIEAGTRRERTPPATLPPVQE